MSSPVVRNSMLVHDIRPGELAARVRAVNASRAYMAEAVVCATAYLDTIPKTKVIRNKNGELGAVIREGLNKSIELVPTKREGIDGTISARFSWSESAIWLEVSAWASQSNDYGTDFSYKHVEAHRIAEIVDRKLKEVRRTWDMRADYTLEEVLEKRQRAIAALQIAIDLSAECAPFRQ